MQTWWSDGPSKETLHGLEHERERRIAEAEEVDQRHAEMDKLFKADTRLREKRCVFCAIPGTLVLRVHTWRRPYHVSEL